MKKIPKTTAEWNDFGPAGICVNRTTKLSINLCVFIKEHHFIETSCYLLRFCVQTSLSSLRMLQLPRVLILPFDPGSASTGAHPFCLPDANRLEIGTTFSVTFSVTLYVTLPHPTDVCQNDRKKPFPTLSSHTASFMPYIQHCSVLHYEICTSPRGGTENHGCSVSFFGFVTAVFI